MSCWQCLRDPKPCDCNIFSNNMMSDLVIKSISIFAASSLKTKYTVNSEHIAYIARLQLKTVTIAALFQFVSPFMDHNALSIRP